MIPSSEILFQTLTVHGAISKTLLWTLSRRKEANFTLLPKQNASRVHWRLNPNKGTQVRETNLSCNRLNGLFSVQMLPTAADRYEWKILIKIWSLHDHNCQKRPMQCAHVSQDLMLPEKPHWCSRAFFLGTIFAVSLQQVISVNDCSCFLDDVWEWPCCPHASLFFNIPSIWLHRSETHVAPGM